MEFEKIEKIEQVEQLEKIAADEYDGEIEGAICSHLQMPYAYDKINKKVPQFLKYEVGQVKAQITKVRKAAAAE